MIEYAESFVRFASGRLVVLNLALLAFIKIVLPFGGMGFAEISQTIQPLSVEAIIEDTNIARTNVLLPSLNHSAVLDRAAEAKLDDMARQGYFAHVNPDGRQAWYFISTHGYAYRAAGENLARGFTNPQDIVTAWMQSAAHRANIINPAYQDIGVAVRRTTINGNATTVVVQLFGTPAPVAVKPVIPKPAVFGVSSLQAISTDTSIPQVQAPLVVAEGQGIIAQSVTRTLSSVATIYLVGLMGLLILCSLVIRERHSLTRALIAHVGILLIFTVIPAVPVIQHLIF